MNYLSEIPSELLHLTCSFLNYKNIQKLYKTLELNLDSIPYETILSVKYPGFYHIIKTIKRENNSYKNYPWETGFELIDRIDRYIKNIHDGEYCNVYSSNPEEIMDILIMGFKFNEVHDMTAAYTISLEYKDHKYYKFMKYMPIIQDINKYLLPIFDGGVEIVHNEKLNMSFLCGRTKRTE